MHVHFVIAHCPARCQFFKLYINQQRSTRLRPAPGCRRGARRCCRAPTGAAPAAAPAAGRRRQQQTRRRCRRARAAAVGSPAPCARLPPRRPTAAAARPPGQHPQLPQLLDDAASSRLGAAAAARAPPLPARLRTCARLPPRRAPLLPRAHRGSTRRCPRCCLAAAAHALLRSSSAARSRCRLPSAARTAQSLLAKPVHHRQPAQ